MNALLVWPYNQCDQIGQFFKLVLASAFHAILESFEQIQTMSMKIRMGPARLANIDGAA